MAIFDTKNKKMNKIKFTLPFIGALSSIAAPIAVISCSSSTAEHYEKMDLDKMLSSHESNESVFNKMQHLLNGDVKRVVIGKTEYDMSTYETNDILKNRFREFMYNLSLIYPTILPSVPNGQVIFSQDKIVDIKPMKAKPDSAFASALDIDGGGSRIYLGKKFPKAPDHSHYMFMSESLVPELPDSAKKDSEFIEGKWAGAWYIDSGDREGQYSIGQLSIPSIDDKKIELKIKLVPDNGFILNDSFEKTLKLKTSTGPITQEIKDMAMGVYFTHKLFSMDDAGTQAPEVITDVKDTIKGIMKQYVDAALYGFAMKGAPPKPRYHYNIEGIKHGYTDSSDPTKNIPGFKELWNDLLSKTEWWFDTSVRSALQVNQLANDFEKLTTYFEMCEFVKEHLRGYYVTYAVQQFEKHWAEFGPQGTHHGSSLPMDVDKTTFMGDNGDELAGFNDAIDKANTLNELKAITDKFNSLSQLKDFDYQGLKSLLSIDGATNFAEMTALMNGANKEKIAEIFKQGFNLDAIPEKVIQKTIILVPDNEK